MVGTDLIYQPILATKTIFRYKKVVVEESKLP